MLSVEVLKALIDDLEELLHYRNQEIDLEWKEEIEYERRDRKILKRLQVIRNRTLELEKQAVPITNTSTIQVVSEDVHEAAGHYAHYFSDGSPVLVIETAIDMIVSDMGDEPEGRIDYAHDELLRMLFDLAKDGFDEVTLEVE